MPHANHRGLAYEPPPSPGISTLSSKRRGLYPDLAAGSCGSLNEEFFGQAKEAAQNAVPMGSTTTQPPSGTAATAVDLKKLLKL